MFCVPMPINSFCWQHTKSSWLGGALSQAMPAEDALCVRNFNGETPLLQAAGAPEPGAFQVLAKTLSASEVWSVARTHPNSAQNAQPTAKQHHTSYCCSLCKDVAVPIPSSILRAILVTMLIATPSSFHWDSGFPKVSKLKALSIPVPSVLSTRSFEPVYLRPYVHWFNRNVSSSCCCALAWSYCTLDQLDAQLDLRTEQAQTALTIATRAGNPSTWRAVASKMSPTTVGHGSP